MSSPPARVPDAHCHLADLDSPPDALAEAIAAGVGPVLAVSMGSGDARRVIAIRDAAPAGSVLAGVGIHPSRVPALDDQALEAECAAVEALAPRADFLGECGLDDKDARSEDDRRRQREVLDRMFACAVRHRLPVNLHTRRADRELLDRAERFTRASGLGVILHWFTHSATLARRCGASGIWISAGPSCLIDERQAEVARHIAPDFLLVETDSPVVYAGDPARPAWAGRVADRLAALRGEDPGGIARRLAINHRAWLGPARGAS